MNNKARIERALFSGEAMRGAYLDSWKRDSGTVFKSPGSELM